MNTKFLFFLSAIACCFAPRVSAQNTLWTFSTPYVDHPVRVVASPVVGRDGTVYITPYDRNVYALTSSGAVMWITELPEPSYIYDDTTFVAVFGTPAIGVDGTLYVPSENGKLLALNPTNGAINWEYQTPTYYLTTNGPSVTTNYY